MAPVGLDNWAFIAEMLHFNYLFSRSASWNAGRGGNVLACCVCDYGDCCFVRRSSANPSTNLGSFKGLCVRSLDLLAGRSQSSRTCSTGMARRRAL